jgi:hypothetical protein
MERHFNTLKLQQLTVCILHMIQFACYTAAAVALKQYQQLLLRLEV